MSSSFYDADKRTHRKTILVGLAFFAVCCLARPQDGSDAVVVKADRPVRSAGQPLSAN